MYLDVGLCQRASRSNRPSCCVSTQERGTRTSAGAGRDTCDVAATLRGGELGPKRDFTESTDRGSPATVISEVRVCSPCLRRLHSLDTDDGGDDTMSSHVHKTRLHVVACCLGEWPPCRSSMVSSSVEWLV